MLKLPIRLDRPLFRTSVQVPPSSMAQAGQDAKFFQRGKIEVCHLPSPDPCPTACDTGVSRRSSGGRSKRQKIREKENRFEENCC